MRTHAHAPAIAHTIDGTTTPAARIARLAAGALLAVTASLGLSAQVAAPANAHDELSGTSFTMTPDTDELAGVTLQFSDEVLDIGHEIRVTDADGTPVNDGSPTVSGRDVTQNVTSGLPAGSYSVAWRVVSSDGHPIEGFLAFMVADDGAPSWIPADQVASPSAEPSAPVAEGEHDDHSDHSDHGAGGEAAGAEAATDAETGAQPWIVIAAIAGVLVVGGAVAAILIGNTRRRAAIAQAGTAGSAESAPAAEGNTENGADR